LQALEKNEPSLDLVHKIHKSIFKHAVLLEVAFCQDMHRLPLKLKSCYSTYKKRVKTILVINRNEILILTGTPFDYYPPHQWHATVMINMKKSDLVVLLAKDEKYLMKKNCDKKRLFG
jgi:hypothetical protein